MGPGCCPTAKPAEKRASPAVDQAVMRRAVLVAIFPQPSLRSSSQSMPWSLAYAFGRRQGEQVRFAEDSPVEGDGFEPSVPQEERFCEQTSSSPPAGKIV